MVLLALSEDTEDMRINLEDLLSMRYVNKKACMYLKEEYKNLSILWIEVIFFPPSSILCYVRPYFIHTPVFYINYAKYRKVA